MNAPVRVAVVGGGALGLAVAHRLSGDGRTVTCFAPTNALGAAVKMFAGHVLDAAKTVADFASPVGRIVKTILTLL